MPNEKAALLSAGVTQVLLVGGKVYCIQINNQALYALICSQECVFPQAFVTSAFREQFNVFLDYMYILHINVYISIYYVVL